MSEEKELEFKRFSKDKQEQIRQLVSFATLMGLTGKDLVSIGGKLSRIESAQEIRQRKTAVEGYDVKPIGKTPITSRFKLTIGDVTYHFNGDDYYSEWTVKNTKTNRTLMIAPSRNDWGRVSWNKRTMYDVLWALHQGSAVLP